MMLDSLHAPDEAGEITIRLKKQLNSPRSMSGDDGDVDCIKIGKSRFSALDVQVVRESMSYMNPFLARRATEKQQLVFMREVLATGEITSLEISLRQLLGCVNSVADSIDARDGEGKDLKTFGTSSPESFFKLAVSRPVVPDAQSATINLRVRDLRRLDFNFNPNEEPSIWVRRHAVMFSVDPIRAIIMGSRVVIIVPPGGMDQILNILERFMGGRTLDFLFVKCLTLLLYLAGWERIR